MLVVVKDSFSSHGKTAHAVFVYYTILVEMQVYFQVIINNFEWCQSDPLELKPGKQNGMSPFDVFPYETPVQLVLTSHFLVLY